MNIGFFFVRSSQLTVEFFLHLIMWLWYHPFDHDQMAFQTLLQADARTLHKSDVRWPHWSHLLGLREAGLKHGILDPYNSFVSSRVYEYDGWTGSIDKIVAYHFLDGQGGVSDSDAVNKGYVSNWEMFYTNPSIDLNSHIPIYEQNTHLNSSIHSSRVPAVPQELNPCITWDNRNP